MNTGNYFLCRRDHLIRFSVRGDNVRIVEHAGCHLVRERTLSKDAARGEYRRLKSEGYEPW